MTDDRVTKAVRLRALTDPLGAKGYRRTRQRVARETSARKTVFAVALAAFLVSFGLVAGSRHGAPAANAASLPNASQASASSNVFGQFGTGRHHRFAADGQQGLPSFFSPSDANSSDGSVPHVTTRTS